MQIDLLSQHTCRWKRRSKCRLICRVIKICQSECRSICRVSKICQSKCRLICTRCQSKRDSISPRCQSKCRSICSAYQMLFLTLIPLHTTHVPPCCGQDISVEDTYPLFLSCVFLITLLILSWLIYVSIFIQSSLGMAFFNHFFFGYSLIEH